MEGSTIDAHEVLRLARGHVRTRTRTPTYLAHGDRFATAFLGKPLGVASEYVRSVGTDLASILDTCYEQLLPQGEHAAPALKQATQALQDMVHLLPAAGALPSLPALLAVPSCDFIDVARAILAVVTTLGHAALTRRASLEVADDWLELWQERVGRHNHQQQLHSGVTLLLRLPPEAQARVLALLEIPPTVFKAGSTTFTASVREYLALFSDTSAAAMTFVGVLPFAERFSGDEQAELLRFMKATPELLDLVNGLLRLAQDVTFDESELLNTRAAAASDRQGSDVPTAASPQRIRIETDEEKMWREWDVFLPECQKRMDAIVCTLAGQGSLHHAMSDLVAATSRVAQALTSAPHKK